MFMLTNRTVIVTRIRKAIMVILPNLFSALLNWPMSSGWIKVNVGQIGYYRVNYEKENWRALCDQLNSDHRVSINLRP